MVLKWSFEWFKTDYPVAYCRDPHEWMALIRAMVDQKWLNTNHAGFGVTLAGLEKLRELPPAEVPEQATTGQPTPTRTSTPSRN